MSYAAACLWVLMQTGCTSTRITHTEPTWLYVGTNLVRNGGGFVIERTTGLTKHTVADLQVVSTTNSISFGMKRYNGDAVSGLEAAVGAAVRAGIAGATGR